MAEPKDSSSLPLVTAIPRIRSMRLRVLFVVVVVTLAPLSFVAGSSCQEARTEETLRANVDVAAREAAEALTQLGPADDNAVELARRVHAVAERLGVRIRVLSPQGSVQVDALHERSPDVAAKFGEWFFGPDGAPSLQRFDAALPELRARDEVRDAIASGQVVGCGTSTDAKLLVCHGVRSVLFPGSQKAFVVHAQDGARRAIRALYDVRYQLLKLTLFIFPLSILLAWWLGWRMVRPLEQLRRQALAMAPLGTAASGLDLPRRDEFGDLASAFNALLKALHERRKANEAFVADLAHEFKNPVAAIRAVAESLSDGSIDATRAGRLSGVLQDSSRRLDAPVTQLLELARVESGMPNEQRASVDVAALVQGVVANVSAQYEEKRIAIEVQAAAGVEVLGVGGRIESAVRNLVDNAASFAPEGGRVGVDILVDKRLVTLRVSDNGPGIAPQDLPRVFERFFTTRGSRKGTGLGLALVRAVAEAHGGAVRVSSNPGEGTTFELLLPRRTS